MEEHALTSVSCSACVAKASQMAALAITLQTIAAEGCEITLVVEADGHEVQYDIHDTIWKAAPPIELIPDLAGELRHIGILIKDEELLGLPRPDLYQMVQFVKLHGAMELPKHLRKFIG